jgi:hypothetical protein
VLLDAGKKKKKKKKARESQTRLYGFTVGTDSHGNRREAYAVTNFHGLGHHQ